MAVKTSPVVSKKPTKKASDHPTYKEMIKDAVVALKDRKGSSRQAIVKYVKDNNKVSDDCDQYVKQALAKAVVSGLFVQTSGKGASGSFKLAKVEKKPVVKAQKTAVAKKPSVAKKVSVAKKPSVVKKPTVTAKKIVTKKTVKKPVSPAKKSPRKVAKKSLSTKKSTIKKTTSKAKANVKKPDVKKTASKKTTTKK